MLRSLFLLGLLATLGQSLNALCMNPINITMEPIADRTLVTKKISISVTNKAFGKRDILLVQITDEEIDTVGREPSIGVLLTDFAQRITRFKLAPGETRVTDFVTFPRTKGLLMIRVASDLDTAPPFDLYQNIRILPECPFPNIMRIGEITRSEAADEYNEIFNGPIIYFECKSIELPPAPDWAVTRRE